MGRAFEYRKARKLKRWGHMARVFTKIGKEIEIAVKAGGPDPSGNTRLRILMQNAKAENMPKENVERAIKRATEKDAADYKEVIYEGYGSHGIAFLVADQPLLSASAVRAVVRQWREHPSCIVGAACGTRRGNPNVFPREFFPALCALEGDRGGSAVIRQYPERYLAVDVPPEALADVDTPEALRAIRDHL